MLCLHHGMLDWCGLVDVRRAPIATEFCVAENFRNVPQTDIGPNGLTEFGPDHMRLDEGDHAHVLDRDAACPSGLPL